ncbi:MAG TPA: DUF6152 family protein [Gammaproteobacteria bacterium]
MRMRITLLAATTLATGSFALPGLAHHAASMFDRNQTVALEGEVVEFQWTSPHIWIQIAVENEDGQREEWSVEGGVPNRLYRSGWRPNSFEPGDQVVIVGNPMRDGGKAALFIGARLADGSTLGRFEE